VLMLPLSCFRFARRAGNSGACSFAHERCGHTGRRESVRRFVRYGAIVTINTKTRSMLPREFLRPNVSIVPATSERHKGRPRWACRGRRRLPFRFLSRARHERETKVKIFQQGAGCRSVSGLASGAYPGAITADTIHVLPASSKNFSSMSNGRRLAEQSFPVGT